jgi:hypothetical protein
MYLLYRAVGSGRLDVDVEASIDPSGRESGVICDGSRAKLADEYFKGAPRLPLLREKSARAFAWPAGVFGVDDVCPKPGISAGVEAPNKVLLDRFQAFLNGETG